MAAAIHGSLPDLGAHTRHHDCPGDQALQDVMPRNRHFDGDKKPMTEQNAHWVGTFSVRMMFMSDTRTVIWFSQASAELHTGVCGAPKIQFLPSAYFRACNRVRPHPLTCQRQEYRDPTGRQRRRSGLSDSDRASLSP